MRPINILVGSDIHAVNGDSRLQEALSLVSKELGGERLDTILLGGDYVGMTGERMRKSLRIIPGVPIERSMSAEQLQQWQPVFDVSDVRMEMEAALGYRTRSFFTYGSHDKNALHGANAFFSGPASLGPCYLYGISFGQMRFASTQQMTEAGYEDPDAPLGGADRGAETFLRWIDSLANHKPILIMSHIPLHASRPGNKGASIWADAFHKAAESHDLFVLFGHNHTAEQRINTERCYYLVPHGQTISIRDETGAVKEDPLDYTYLNAGYIVSGCVTLLTLTGKDRYDTVIIRRLSQQKEQQAFGATGFSSPYSVSLRWPVEL